MINNFENFNVKVRRCGMIHNEINKDQRTKMWTTEFTILHSRMSI